MMDTCNILLHHREYAPLAKPSSICSSGGESKVVGDTVEGGGNDSSAVGDTVEGGENDSSAVGDTESAKTLVSASCCAMYAWNKRCMQSGEETVADS